LPTEPLIQVRGVSITLGAFAVHEASLEVGAGEYFVLLGPTGAGKTVLLECIAGLHRPERGEIVVAGQRVNQVPPEQRGLGYLPQDYALFPHLNVAQNIAFGMRLRRQPRSAINRRVAELAELLKITHLLARSTVRLSGGEKQRAALARALAIEPKVLLLDEPLSALDEQTREMLCVELRRVHAELRTTTVHVSHNFEETLAVADRIGIIHEGRICQVGTPEEVFYRPASEFVARFVRADNILRGRARRSADGLVVTVGATEFQAANGPEGEVFLTVRPEDVELAPAPAADATVRSSDAPSLRSTSRTNLVTGPIVRVVDRGPLVRVDVGGEAPLTALVARRGWRASGLKTGDLASAFFDPEAAHLLPAD